MITTVGARLRSAAEAIPGNRVVISDACGHKDLEHATAVVISPDEYTQRFTFSPGLPSSVGIALDEPYATQWGRRDIYMPYRSLSHAPSYEELVVELARALDELEAERKVKANLTTENETLARRLSEVRTAYANAQMQSLPFPRQFIYPVCSHTTPDKFYDITVCDNEVIKCTCLGWKYRGHCKHADHFRIPQEAWDDARRYRLAVNHGKQGDVLRQIAELVKPFGK